MQLQKGFFRVFWRDKTMNETKLVFRLLHFILPPI